MKASGTRHGMYRHGMRGTPTYKSWNTAKQRCFNSRHHKYHLYGGRGVTMCDRWRSSFADFLADMGERPAGTTLDRYPNKDGNYEPGNCRWATATQQNNNRSINRTVIYREVEMTASEAMRAAGSIVPIDTVCRRIDAGWSTEHAVETPATAQAERRWSGIGDEKRAANGGSFR